MLDGRRSGPSVRRTALVTAGPGRRLAHGLVAADPSQRRLRK